MALTVISSLSDVFRRDYEVPSAELPDQTGGFLNPNSSDALKSGEWLLPNSSNQYIRSTALHTSDPLAKTDGTTTQLLMKCVFSEQGDYTNQALGKVTLIQSHGWEGETDMYSGTPTVGDALGLIADANGRVVLVATTTQDDLIVAICTRGVSGSKIRFQAVQPYFHI